MKIYYGHQYAGTERVNMPRFVDGYYSAKQADVVLARKDKEINRLRVVAKEAITKLSALGANVDALEDAVK